MSGFSGQRCAIVDLAFATFGKPAAWSGQPSTVTIRIRSADQDDRFGTVSLKRRSTILRVRSWEIAAPQPGDEVTLGPDVGNVSYVVGDGVMLDRKGVWDCPARQTP
ncbi:hypothetical protein GCM10022253_24000 [Sphingomonas endophytica]|uniref:Uncharacterized protein n=1 Tax=Sphingomonas endophytica TaxID=869719 RepID=A0ABR6N2P7_9SPHN|nr:hypothetical protein [Sphingomonas endophytica]MBB5725048.1 hypothetical protein [Sphingomonas endophytica]